MSVFIHAYQPTRDLRHQAGHDIDYSRRARLPAYARAASRPAANAKRRLRRFV